MLLIEKNHNANLFSNLGLNHYSLEHVIGELGGTFDGIRGIVRMRQTCHGLKEIIDKIVMKSEIFRNGFIQKPRELRAFYTQSEPIARLQQLYYKTLNSMIPTDLRYNELIRSIDNLGRSYQSLSLLERLAAFTGLDSSEYSTEGFTTLHYACYYGTVGEIKLLLNLGADIEQPCAKLGSTPLCFVVQKGKIDYINFLIKRGACLEGAKRSKKTPILWTKDLIKQRNPNALKTIRLLIEKGANFLAKDKSGNTLLHYAAKAGFTELILELIRTWNFPVNVKNNQGKTPMWLSHNLKTLEIFLGHKASYMTERPDFKEKILDAVIEAIEMDNWDDFLILICKKFEKVEGYTGLLPLIEEIISQPKVQARLPVLELSGVHENPFHDNSEKVSSILKSLAPGIISFRFRHLINGKITSLLQFHRLQELHLDPGEYLNDNELSQLARLIHLKKLYLCGMPAEISVSTWRKFNQLSFLSIMGSSYVSTTELNKGFIQSLKGLRQFNALQIINMTCEDEKCWLSICELKSLRELFLHDTTITDEFLLQLRNLPDLRVLSLQNNKNITEKGVSALKEMKLTDLDLSYNPQISEELIDSIPATHSDLFENDLLVKIWKIILDKQLFFKLLEEIKDEFNFSVEYLKEPKKMMLYCTIILICKTHLYQSFLDLINFAKGDLALSQENLDICLKTNIENDGCPKIRQFLIDAGAHQKK